MKKGDRVLLQGSGYTFDGEVGIVSRVWHNGCIFVTVPSYNPAPSRMFCLRHGEWRHIGFWTDRLEAEKELDILLEKYAA